MFYVETNGPQLKFKIHEFVEENTKDAKVSNG